LVSGKSSPSQGRVEVFFKGTWGAVCGSEDEGWNARTANVACRELGLGNVLTATKVLGVRKKCLSNVWCKGNEDSISGCGDYITWENYGSDLLAVVECSGGKISFKMSISCTTDCLLGLK